MPFDPTQPVEGNTLDAGTVRANLVALFDLIRAMASITGAPVGGVATHDPVQGAAALGQPADAAFLLLHLARGGRAPGAAGSVTNGAVVGSVSSVGSADSASASVSYDRCCISASRSREALTV